MLDFIKKNWQMLLLSIVLIVVTYFFFTSFFKNGKKETETLTTDEAEKNAIVDGFKDLDIKDLDFENLPEKLGNKQGSNLMNDFVESKQIGVDFIEPNDGFNIGSSSWLDNLKDLETVKP